MAKGCVPLFSPMLGSAEERGVFYRVRAKVGKKRRERVKWGVKIVVAQRRSLERVFGSC